MALRRRVDPTSARALADFWLPALAAAPSVPFADLDDARPPVGAVGAYLWQRRNSAGLVEELLYAGSGRVRDRLTRERKKILDASNLDREGIEVAYLLTDGPAIAAMVELLAIEMLNPEWQGTGFGSNHPGPTRSGQRRAKWDTDHDRAS